MNLKLTLYQIALIQEMIYNEIDRCGGIEYISEDLKAILAEIREKTIAKYGSK
jgi:hypothetical protein